MGDCLDLDDLLREGLRLEEYPILGYLIKEDLEGLFRFAEGFGFSESSKGYLSKCHLCMDMRKYLVEKREFKELRPKEFYMQLKQK